MRDVALWKNTADSHAKWAETRQLEYECLRDKWSNLHHDKLDLKDEVANLTKKLEKARLNRIALQGERGILKKDLEDSRQQLISHPVPNVAEAAQKDTRIRDLQVENDSMKKKLELANGQLEYARGMYQDSSSRAVELASELESLQKIFEPTKSKLDVCTFEAIVLLLPPIFRAQAKTQCCNTLRYSSPSAAYHPLEIRAKSDRTRSMRFAAASTRERPIRRRSSCIWLSRRSKR